MQIDLNCDMGEGMNNDAALMPFVSSANITCGYHAGNDESMHRTIACALTYNVAIGAHRALQTGEFWKNGTTTDR